MMRNPRGTKEKEEEEAPDQAGGGACPSHLTRQAVMSVEVDLATAAATLAVKTVSPSALGPCCCGCCGCCCGCNGRVDGGEVASMARLRRKGGYGEG